jgi:hypothetical protein
MRRGGRGQVHFRLAKDTGEYIMDSMFRDKKGTQQNFKDPSAPLRAGSSNVSFTLSYTKTEKLVTALYMVTDIIDRDEPLRNKLRTLGTGIISDINSSPIQAVSKISEIMSFLDIASAINIISQMNSSILRKEFLELDQSLRESSDKASIVDKKIDLSEFFNEEGEESHPSLLKNDYPAFGRIERPALSKAEGKIVKDMLPSVHGHMSPEQFDSLKKQRREDIINIIKIIGGNATIKDIKDKAQSLPDGAGGRSSSLKNCGEKTLQRELASMVSEGVLKKEGSKRWSRYMIKVKS